MIYMVVGRYSVEDTGESATLKLYRNTSTLFGVDPYPCKGPLPLGFPAAVLLTIKMLRKRGRFLSIFLPCLRGLLTI